MKTKTVYVVEFEPTRPSVGGHEWVNNEKSARMN